MRNDTLSTVEQIAAAFNDHRREVRNFLRGQLKCEHTADDLTQETYLRLMRARDVPAVQDWRALIFRVARNLAIDHLRRRGRRTAFELELEALYEITGDTPDIDATLDCEEDMTRLESSLQELSPQCRKVFELSRNEGLGHREIADRLGMSVRTVARRMALSMSFLRERMRR